MSLFGSSPPDEPSDPLRSASAFAAANRSSLFEDEPPMTRSTTTALFADDDGPDADGPDGRSPWDLPTPRKPQTRAELLRGLLPAGDVPEEYGEAFEAVAGGRGVVDAGGVARTLAAAKLGADEQATIMGIAVAPVREAGGEVALDRNQFNVVLALVGLAQEGEVVNFDSVDERRLSEYLFRMLRLSPRWEGAVRAPAACCHRGWHWPGAWHRMARPLHQRDERACRSGPPASPISYRS